MSFTTSITTIIFSTLLVTVSLTQCKQHSTNCPDSQKLVIIPEPQHMQNCAAVQDEKDKDAYKS